MTLGKVLVTAGSVKGCEKALELMRAAGCQVEVDSTPMPWHEEWLLERTRDAAAVIFAMEPVSARLLEHAKSLKIVARPGVGFDTVDLEAATRCGVAVTIAEGMNHESVADHTLGLLLMLARGLLPAANGVMQGRWDRVVGTEVWGKTIAVVGMGRIGQAVARRARGFSMRVLAVTRHPDGVRGKELGLEYVGLNEALGSADFVSLHAPLTPQTAGLIDARALARMKRGAYLINTSRGDLVDERALADAVTRGHLAGAAVDVLQVQGVGSPSPLVGVQGIVVTPHMATFSREAMERVALSAATAVVSRLRGEVPRGLVNPAALDAA